MTRPTLCAGIASIGAAALAAVTLAHPGATRMYQWPWNLVASAALVAPALILLLRVFDRRRPLTLSSGPWCATLGAAALVVLASALASPYRASSLGWSGSLLAGIAFCLVAIDWLNSDSSPEAVEKRRMRLLTAAGLFFALVAATSMGLWIAQLPRQPDLRTALLGRNAFPLGHANYTAGLALLMLPCFAALAFRSAGSKRLAWIVAALLAAGMLFTSGSRAGFIGLAVLAVAFAPAASRAMRVKLWILAVGGSALALVFVAANPRIRSTLSGTSARSEPNSSDVERAAMAKVGFLMGSARPWLGWGPGTTPLAYPRFRAQVDGGVEDVLELHSVPVQLWAELGAPGLMVALALLILAGRAAISQSRPADKRQPYIPEHGVLSRQVGPALAAGPPQNNSLRSYVSPAAVFLALCGYGIFSFFDWQFDVPVFAFALAAAFALLAPPAAVTCPIRRGAFGIGALGALALVAFVGRGDPTPGLNVRALASAADPLQSSAAPNLLRESLALNPDQEIAHFNLGWLLVVSAPAEAESHFRAAARLVPDKGGVYFGIGLARLNQGDDAAAMRAFAIEAVNDPIFLVSPWWRNASFKSLRAAHPGELARIAEEAADRAAAGRDRDLWVVREARYNAALAAWLTGRVAIAEILARAFTSERVSFFAARPAVPAFDLAPIHAYRRERTGYPVLMRNLDLPVPVDLFDVQENSLATGDLRFLFSHKGWLPSPVLLTLLDTEVPPKP